MTSFGIFIVLLFIVAAGVMVIIINPMINDTIDIVNPNINDGTLSSKYATYFNFSVGLAKALPVFILIGVAGWAIVRSLEKRGQEGV